MVQLGSLWYFVFYVTKSHNIQGSCIDFDYIVTFSDLEVIVLDIPKVGLFCLHQQSKLLKQGSKQDSGVKKYIFIYT